MAKFLFIIFYLTNLFPVLAQQRVANQHIVVIAHRGDHTKAPENTLLAYQHAIEAGADYVEVDLRTTMDNQLVVMHDETVDRMTDGHGKVNGMSLEQLKKLKVTDKKNPSWGTHPVPTFEDVLLICKGKINIYLDFKDATAEAAYRALKKVRMEKNVVVYINSPEQLADWQSVAPDVPLMVSLPSEITNINDLKNCILEADIDILDGNYAYYTKELVNTAKNLKIPIWADIQSSHENEKEWQKALDLGLDGLQTDHPEDLIRYLTKKGLR